jgi:putative oxidoreductase
MIRTLFAPGESSTFVGIGLLVLRVWLGLTMFINHGLQKLQDYSKLKADFPDPLGIGSSTLFFVLLAECLCALLLVMGLLTRAAALGLAFTMGVAFFMVHKTALSGAHSGELAFIYMAGFVAILLAGPGKFSSDQWVNAKTLGKKEAKKT